MNRRDFLRANRSLGVGWALSKALPVLADTPAAGEWRTFEVVTRVELLKPSGVSHIWLPAPLIRNTAYQKTISTRFSAEGGTTTLSKDKQSALGIVSARYGANVKPVLSLTSRVALKNYGVDFSSPATAPAASRAQSSPPKFRPPRWSALCLPRGPARDSRDRESPQPASRFQPAPRDTESSPLGSHACKSH